jgi:hypothetical protein
MALRAVRAPLPAVKSVRATLLLAPMVVRALPIVVARSVAVPSSVSAKSAGLAASAAERLVTALRPPGVRFAPAALREAGVSLADIAGN